MLISDHMLLVAAGSGDTNHFSQALPSQGAKYCDFAITTISATSVSNFGSVSTVVQWSNDLTTWEDHDSSLVVYDAPDVKLQAGVSRLPGDYVRLKYTLNATGATSLLMSANMTLKTD